MENRPNNLLAQLLGATTALAGLGSAPCSSGDCLACLRCASVGVGVLIAALLLRSEPRRAKETSTPTS